MADKLSKIEKRTAYALILPAILLVFSIILFPIFANIWISFKEVELKDIRIPEPRAKKIIKSISDDPSKLKIIYKLRNSSLLESIFNVKFYQKLIVLLIAFSIFLIFPESSKELENICQIYNSRKICNVW